MTELNSFLGATFLDEADNKCIIIREKEAQYFVLYGDHFDQDGRFCGKFKYLDSATVNKILIGRFIEFAKEPFILKLIELGELETTLDRLKQPLN